MEEIPIVRLNVALAKIMAEHKDKADPLVRYAIDMIFKVDEETLGEHSTEFLQGIFSGVMLARYRILHDKEPSRESSLISELAVLLAQKYIDKVEQENKMTDGPKAAQ